MKDKSIGRREQQKILEDMTPEQKLDALENERKNVLELEPEIGMRIFIEAFRRKCNDDSQGTDRSSKK
jgi:hypothetical protein